MGASTTNSSHSITYTEECVESILALPPLPKLSKVPDLTDNQVRDLRHILPRDYIPVYFDCNNNAFHPPGDAFHLAFLAWRYDTILSQAGAAQEYIFMHYDQLICRPNYSHNSWKSWKAGKYDSSDTDYIFKLTLDIDAHVKHCQYAMSLLWHNVWLLQYLPSSTKLNYMEYGVS